MEAVGRRPRIPGRPIVWPLEDSVWVAASGHSREASVGVARTPLGVAKLEGQLEQNQAEFQFSVSGAPAGVGRLRLSSDRQELLTMWKPKGAPSWSVSTGQRVKSDPSKVWLVVLEAHWEHGLNERPYSFGSMLQQYFTMSTARHVEFRHRYFHDTADLRRFCEETALIGGPVVLLLSTHGNPEGIEVGGKVIGSGELADCLHGASNVFLLHLSGCSMMQGTFPKEVQQLSRGTSLTISGYKQIVGWEASAIADFTFLTLALVKGLTATEAARQAILASPYLGDSESDDQVFAPLGLTVLPAQSDAANRSREASP